MNSIKASNLSTNRTIKEEVEKEDNMGRSKDQFFMTQVDEPELKGTPAQSENIKMN